MSFEKRRLLQRVCGILLSALLVAAGVLLAVSCVQIYKQGDSPFTRESVSAAFSRIAVPIYLTVFSVVATAVLAMIFPLEETKLRAKMTEETQLARLSAKEGLTAPAQKEEKLRRVLRAVAAAVTVIAALIPLFYLLNKANYAGDATYNEIVIAGVVRVAIFAAVAFATCMIVSFLCHASVKRELTILKGEGERVKNTAVPCRLTAWMKKHEKQTLLVLRCALLVLGVVLVIVGILHGGMADVLGKAINICTECIGLG